MKHPDPSRPLVRAARRAVAALLLLALPCGAAAGPSWKHSAAVQVHVHEQPLATLLRTLSAESGLPLVLSDAVKASVSGRFRGPPQQVFEELLAAHGLTQFFDGHALHVNTLGETSSRVLPLPAERVGRLRAMLAQLGIADSAPALRWLQPEPHLVVSGPPRLIQLVGELCALMEQSAVQPGAPTLKVFRLRQAWARDFSISHGGQTVELPGVATLLRRAMGLGESKSAGAGHENREGRRASLPAKGAGSLAGAGESNLGPAAAASPAAGPAPAGEAGLFSPSVTDDPGANLVIVRDTAARMPLYEALIQEFDRPQQLLEITATVIDVDASQSEQLGVNWRLQRKQGLDLAVGRPGSELAGSAAELLAGASGLSGLVGSIVLGRQNQHFSATLEAMVRDGQARLSAKPRVLTLNNHEALLESRQSFFVRVAGRDAGNLFELSAGLSMRVTPQLVGSGEAQQVKLLISIEDGTLSQERVDQVPVVNRKNLNTQAVIQLGDSLFIGGYEIEQSSQELGRVPGLGDLPLVGALFRQKEQRQRRSERMFLITPRLIGEPRP